MTYDSICHMKRTTIFLPEALERRLRQFARRQEKPVAAVVREALGQHLDAHREPFRLPPTFDSGRTDISERIDELMFKGVNAHGEPVSRPKRRRA